LKNIDLHFAAIRFPVYFAALAISISFAIKKNEYSCYCYLTSNRILNRFLCIALFDSRSVNSPFEEKCLSDTKIKMADMIEFDWQ